MSALKTHIFDLPPIVLEEILLRLDHVALLNLSKTCEYMMKRVEHFRRSYPQHCENIYIAYQMEPEFGNYNDEEDDDFDAEEDDYEHGDYLDEDRYSCGSFADDDDEADYPDT